MLCIVNVVKYIQILSCVRQLNKLYLNFEHFYLRKFRKSLGNHEHINYTVIDLAPGAVAIINMWEEKMLKTI